MAGLRHVWLAALIGLAVHAEAGPAPISQITIWQEGAFGGSAYGGAAMIFEQREIDVTATGEVRLSNIAGTADPASMQLRDLTDKTATISEQRFYRAAKSPTDMMRRRIGESVTVVTPKGDVTGILRGVDEHALVVEVGTGDARRVSVMRREFALDVRMPGPMNDRPSAHWKLATTKPGKHSIELVYRADGLSWTADYLAVLDEPAKLVDFTAWATIKNETGVVFDGAEVTLVGGNIAGVAISGAGLSTFSRPPPAYSRFVVPKPVKLTADRVQLELFPPRVGAKVRTVTSFEAIPDSSSEQQEVPGIDCSTNNASSAGDGNAETLLEVDVPSALPEGKVRLFRKKPRVEIAADEPLRSAPGVARIKLAESSEIVGERRAVSCIVDERAHTIHEKVEVKVSSRSAQPVDVVVREFLWRWPVWRVENESVKGARAGAQIQEYRLRVGPKGSQTLTYTAVYTW